MTNRQRAEELARKVLEQMLPSSFISRGMYDDVIDNSILLIEQVISESQPYFDGEYYHLAWWHKDIAEKFMNKEVIFYDWHIEFIEEKTVGYLNYIDEYGFALPYDISSGKYYAYIAIKKEDYECVNV